MYESDIDITKAYLHARNEVSKSMLSKVIVCRQTETTVNITLPHTRAVIPRFLSMLPKASTLS